MEKAIGVFGYRRLHCTENSFAGTEENVEICLPLETAMITLIMYYSDLKLVVENGTNP